MIGYDRIIKTALALLALIAAATVVAGQVRAQDVSSGKEVYETTRFASLADHVRSERHPTGDRRAESRRPRAWCGWWLAHHLGFTGAKARQLWLARNWLHIGQRVARPQPGAIAVYARGRRGGHVGIVKAVTGPNKIILLSGNDGGRVRQRERSTRGVIGYVVL